MPGFLCGILYVNFAAGRYLADTGIFSEYFLKQYESANLVAREYIFYLAGIRIVPFLAVTGLSFTRGRKAAAVGFLMWTGFSAGMLLAMAVLSMGMKGVILCVVGVLPHFLLYVPAYVVVLWYALNYPQCRWNRQKTVFVVITMLMGMILEGYVSPVFMKLFLGTL